MFSIKINTDYSPISPNKIARNVNFILNDLNIHENSIN